MLRSKCTRRCDDRCDIIIVHLLHNPRGCNLVFSIDGGSFEPQHTSFVNTCEKSLKYKRCLDALFYSHNN
jgi:hypothetical protein